MRLSSGIHVPSYYRRDSRIETSLDMEFWGGECGLSLRPLPVHGERIEIRDHNPYGAERGGIGCFRILSQRPKSRELLYELDSWGLDFFHQPTTAERDSFRPDHIKNSYALYHKTKGGLVESSGPDYKAGKAAHLYRSWAEDADGWRVWVPQGFNRSRSLLKLTLPEEFRRKARLPITVDPTFGKTDVGGTNAGADSDMIFGTLFASSEAGTLDSISSYNVAGAFDDGPFLFLIYDGGDDSYMAESAAISSPVSGDWNTAAVSAAIAAQNYWLCQWGEEWSRAYDATGGSSRDILTAYPGTAPDPLPAGTAGTRIFSIYATYTAAAGGGGFGQPLGGRRNNPVAMIG